MEKMIHVDGLKVSYGRGAHRVQAVQDVSFDVAEGECVGFIGANGAGKSTTMKALMGFIPHQRFYAHEVSYANQFTAKIKCHSDADVRSLSDQD